MYPLTKATTQYNFSERMDIETNEENEEYIYVDDPKDGNASSAEENVEKLKAKEIRNQRLSKSAGPAMAYMRAKAQRLNKEKGEKNEIDSGNVSDDDSCFSIPWRFVPDNILSDLEFYKNADNKLQDQIQKTTQLVFVEKDGKAVAQLKAPINSLFPRELGPQQAARWPADIQVIDRRIKHIPYVPNEPELFYKVSGLEKTPMVRGEDRGGRLVFMYEPRSTFFVRSRVGGIRTGPEQCAVSIDRSLDDTTLVFESRFESGNLAKAIQVGEYEYELWLRYDLYTNKHTQWFYFSISNTRPNVNYRFSIVNFMKPDSLYNYGMKPLMYSEKDALQKKVGWHRCGTGIKYYKNNIKYETSRGDKPFYSLTWNTEVSHKGDTVYFSHCFPYTYTDLQDYLLELSNDPIKSKICKQRVLCRTLAGNLVYLLTITSPSTNPDDIRHKKAVVLTSRVHPGESNSSWMMKGFLDYLTSNTADAKLLRDTFIFKVVPMLNPDGVIVGNYRCSLAGRDLNRNYKTVLKDAYPTVWHTKQMIRRLLQEREIVAYCDLHGHSRRQNVFIYGCENRHQPEKRLRERIFPCMLHKNSPDKFHFDACKFKVQKSKEGTGRIVMWNMGILNSYTMEATFCGSTLGKKKGFHFTTRDYEQMGYDFCDTLLDYCDPDATKVKDILNNLDSMCANVLYDLEENLKQEIRKKLEQKGVNLENVDLSDDLSAYELESSDGGSDSSISDGPPVHLQFQPQREDKATAMEAPKKKKKLKSKKERDRVREGTKDGGKKSGDKDKQASGEDSNSQRKPFSGHQTSHAKQEKLNAQVRYIQGSPKRPKSHDERAQSDTREAHSGASGRRESTEEHQQKRPRKLLETAKCDAEDTQALAVSVNSTTCSTTTPPPNTNTSSTMSGDNFFQTIGLQRAIDDRCYRITSFTSSRPKTSPVRFYKVGLQSPSEALTIKGVKNQINAFSNDYLENLTAAYLRKGILQNQQEQGRRPSIPRMNYEISSAARRLQGKAPAHLRYSGTSGKPPSMPFSLEGLCPHHEQAFAAQLMAQQLQNMTGVVGNSFVRVWKDYLQKHRGQPPKLQQMNMDELTGSGIMSSHSSAQTERRSSRHHLIEVSESQKRQELLQAQQMQIRKPERSASRHGKDDKDQLGGLSSRLRAQIPSATFVNYETFNISQMNLENEGKSEESVRNEETNGKGNSAQIENWLNTTKSLHNSSKNDVVEEPAKKETTVHHKGHKRSGHSGRKSRMGMRDSDDEEEVKQDGPDYVQDPHSHRAPRVKSAKTGGEEFNSAIQSIKDLRQSLTMSAANSNLSPTAGNYIKKLLKQEMKQADDDIEDITAKLQFNIDEKQKQYDELIDSRDSKITAPSPVQRENSIARSAPVATGKDRSNNSKTGKPEQAASAHVKSKAEKKETKKVETQESVNQKLSKSTTSLNGVVTDSVSGVNSRLVDAYHLPDKAQQGHKQDGFKGGKLDTDGKTYLSKLSKPEYTANGKSDINYSSATDLASLGNGTPAGKGVSGGKKRQTGVPRSASSSSSREESWNEKNELLLDKERTEMQPIQRVKSAKNPSRQVVGKRFYLQNKYPKRHQPAVNMLKIEGATCTPATNATAVVLSPSPTPRSVTATTQTNPQLETIPTKISLMITQDHDDTRYSGGHFLPMSRTVRGPFNKSAQPQPKRK